ncbi:FAD-dependent oxidoreductase [Spiroplasma endosymbiont of Aspidapion aeneum]|uniref:FAD-dependent oxidoreductase n=1 Tax=Spiroplasma endosymbiont of Aspidapion aeneum TaxID=3066276 RepID=UPI00313A8F51
MKTIVIGTNHAGTTAIRTLRRLDPKMEVVTYDRNDSISFLGCGIALWVQGEVKDPKGLFYATPELLAKEGISVNMQYEWTKIDSKAKKVWFKDMVTGKEKEDTYDKLIVATGTWPIELSTPGFNLKGVQICKNYDHAQKIKIANEDKSIKNVAVIGAGYIGVELVDAFVKAGKNVTLVDLANRIMPAYYDEDFTNDIEESMKNAKVNIQLGKSVKEFCGTSKVDSITLSDDSKHKVDYVVFCAGVVAQTKHLQGVVDLAENGAVKTNDYCQSSNKDIYAIGDCSQVHNKATDSQSQIALATTAVRTGIIAAMNIVKNNSLPQMGFVGSNGIDVFGWKMAAAGLSEEMCKRLKIDYECKFFEDNDRPEFMSTVEKVKIKLIWEKKSRRLIGAQISSKNNHTESMYLLSYLIQKGVTIDEIPLIDIFFLPHFNKPYNYITLAALEVLGLNYFKK